MLRETLLPSAQAPPIQFCFIASFLREAMIVRHAPAATEIRVRRALPPALGAAWNARRDRAMTRLLRGPPQPAYPARFVDAESNPERPMSWLERSIMFTRGVAGTRQGATHELTEAKQGTFHFTMGPYSQPVLHVKPGDRIVVETRDAFGGAVKTEQDLPSKVLKMPFVNPQNGPIMIEGAEPGDAIAVHIESMKPRGPNPRGTCALIPFFGGLSGTSLTATLNEPLPEIVRKIDVDEQGVYWSKRVTLPYRPHIGTLSTSPEIDSINSLTPDNHGGNMDLPDMGPGSITYLPVRTAGARLFIGDAHACQGDGEICGTAVEFQSTTTIRVDLIKGWTLEWPRLENEFMIMAIGSTRPLEDATRVAYAELVKWLEAEYGYERWDAYMMLSQCGRVRLGNVVDPKYTVGAGIDKTYLVP
jgi:acetamidase/formamidase